MNERRVQHDGDGKIYTTDGGFLFEVRIVDGDEVARRINRLLEERSQEQPQPCPHFQTVHKINEQLGYCACGGMIPKPEKGENL